MSNLLGTCQSQLGIDRGAIKEISEEQKKFLSDEIIDITFEEYEKNPKKPILITFPDRQCNKEIIDSVVDPKKWKSILRDQEIDEGDEISKRIDEGDESSKQSESVNKIHSASAEQIIEQKKGTSMLIG